MNDELSKIFPTGKSLTIQSTEINITPFKFGELPRVFKAIEPISATLFSVFQQADNQVAMIARLVADGGDNIIDLISIGARKPRAWVEGLELDEGVDLLAAILEVNASFFVQKVLPKINHKMEALQQAGQTS